MFKITIAGKILIAVICGLLATMPAAGQDEQADDTPTRSITSKDFKANRAKSTVQAPGPKRISATIGSNRRYKHIVRKPVRRASAQTIPQKAAFKIEEIGITFWRLRPLSSVELKAADIATFSVVIGPDMRETWTAERVNSTTQFNPGDRVRFTIESSRTGYLYIVNREYYTDGTRGEASLIFPTLRTRGGDNRVRAGSLIEIPSATDSVPYFTVTPRRDGYAGEELAAIITSEPIPGIEAERRPQPITRERIEKWLDDWGSVLDIYDAENGVGIAYSADEAAAANSSTRDLTQDEPLPQTIYRVKVRADLPFIVPFELRAAVR